MLSGAAIFACSKLFRRDSESLELDQLIRIKIAMSSAPVLFEIGKRNSHRLQLRNLSER